MPRVLSPQRLCLGRRRHGWSREGRGVRCCCTFVLLLLPAVVSGCGTETPMDKGTVPLPLELRARVANDAAAALGADNLFSLPAPVQAPGEVSEQ
jgi:hypothetical protein